MRPRRAQFDSFLVIRLGVASIFVAFGLDKFGSGPHNEWVGIFARIGLGQWFRVVTAWIEIVGGILLLPRVTRRVAAALLGTTMLGAAIAHLTVLRDPVAAIIPLVLGVVAVATGLQEPSYDLSDLTSRHPSNRARSKIQSTEADS